METSWIPAQDRILVRVDDRPTETPGGISLISNGDAQLDAGEIIAIGQYSEGEYIQEHTDRRHSELKVGRRALFYKEQGMPIPLTEDRENTYAVLHVNDIYFVSDDPEATIAYY